MPWDVSSEVYDPWLDTQGAFVQFMPLLWRYRACQSGEKLMNAFVPAAMNAEVSTDAWYMFVDAIL